MLIGKILGAHGIQGNAKMVSYAASLEIFDNGSTVALHFPDGRREARVVNWVKPHGRAALISFDGADSRESAEALTGCELYIERSRLPRLEEGEFYWFELIGLDVFAVDGAYIGRLDAVMPTGSNDVYVVTHRGREILVPALEKVVVAVDLEKNRMQVDLPEGL